MLGTSGSLIDLELVGQGCTAGIVLAGKNTQTVSIPRALVYNDVIACRIHGD